MITRIKFDLSTEELQIISGTRRTATRKQVTEFVERLLAVSLHRGDAALPVLGPEAPGVDNPALSCTTIDHLFRPGPKAAEDRCYCGKQAWLEPRYRQNLSAGRHVLARDPIAGSNE